MSRQGHIDFCLFLSTIFVLISMEREHPEYEARAYLLILEVPLWSLQAVGALALHGICLPLEEHISNVSRTSKLRLKGVCHLIGHFRFSTTLGRTRPVLTVESIIAVCR